MNEISDVKYYVVEGWASANPDENLKSRIRIAAIPDTFPFRPKHLVGHNSIRHLRRFDEKWKRLKALSSKKADSLYDEKFILGVHDFILTPTDKKFNEYSFHLLQHAIHGSYDKGFQGLHLISKYNKEIVRIEKTKKEDVNGVWEARVFVFNSKRNKTYEKVSTFFPKSWTPTHFMFEIFHAINNIEVSPAITGYSSKTLSGIPVEVVIENNRARSIYPKHQENE